MHIKSNIDRITHKYLFQVLKCPQGYIQHKLHKSGVLDIKTFKGHKALQCEMLIPVCILEPNYISMIILYNGYTMLIGYFVDQFWKKHITNMYIYQHSNINAI